MARGKSQGGRKWCCGFANPQRGGPGGLGVLGTGAQLRRSEASGFGPVPSLTSFVSETCDTPFLHLAEGPAGTWQQLSVKAGHYCWNKLCLEVQRAQP